jgi:hypothetical protein
MCHKLKSPLKGAFVAEPSEISNQLVSDILLTLDTATYIKYCHPELFENSISDAENDAQ